MSDLLTLLKVGADVKLTKEQAQHLDDLIEQQQARIAELEQREADANKKALKHEQMDFGNREYIEMQKQAFGELLQERDELAATVERLLVFDMTPDEYHRMTNSERYKQNLNAIKREGVLILARDLATTGEVDRSILECIEEYVNQRYPDKDGE